MLATLALVAALSTPQTIPAGTYTYRGTVNGSPAWTSTVTVSSSGASLLFAEAISGSYMGIDATGNGKLSLNATDLTPTAYSAAYAGAGRNATSSVSFNGAQAQEKGPTGDRSFSLPAGASHFCVIDGVMSSGFAALPMQFAAWKPQSVFAVAPAYEQAVALSVVHAPARPAGVPSSDTPISVGGQIPFTVWYDPATLVMDELDVPSQEIVVVRAR